MFESLCANTTKHFLHRHIIIQGVNQMFDTNQNDLILKIKY